MKKTILTLSVLFALSTYASADSFKAGDWVFRGTVAHIATDSSSSPVLPTATFGDNGVEAEAGTGLGLAFTYMMDAHWGFEVLLATPFSHDITGTGSIAGLNVGETKQLPPTFSVSYNWGDETKYRVGAGLNYTKFFQESTTADLTAGLNTLLGASFQNTSLVLEESTGLSVHAGFDTPISDDWNFSAAVYLKDIDTEAKVYADGVLASTVDVQIDPVVWTVGLSTTF